MILSLKLEVHEQIAEEHAANIGKTKSIMKTIKDNILEIAIDKPTLLAVAPKKHPNFEILSVDCCISINMFPGRSR